MGNATSHASLGLFCVGSTHRLTIPEVSCAARLWCRCVIAWVGSETPESLPFQIWACWAERTGLTGSESEYLSLSSPHHPTCCNSSALFSPSEGLSMSHGRLSHVFRVLGELPQPVSDACRFRLFAIYHGRALLCRYLVGDLEVGLGRFAKHGKPAQRDS